MGGSVISMDNGRGLSESDGWARPGDGQLPVQIQVWAQVRERADGRV